MKIIKKIINKNNCQIKDEINYEISLIHWMRNIINEHLNIFTIIKKENFLTLKKKGDTKLIFYDMNQKRYK